MDSEENSDNSSCNSQEVIKQVKARLLEEGREARNLVAYSVLLQQRKSPITCDDIHKAVPVKESRKPSVSTLKHEKRRRSASAGRTPQSSLRARHWGFLFRNLEQAVDEIYQTCEDDESIIECKEAILMLERYTKDFHKLIEWLKLKWEFEKTPPPERPVAVTWEIRTSSSKFLSSRRKIPFCSDTKQVLSRLTTENVKYKNEIEQNRKSILNQNHDGESPPRKLSTVKENEFVDKVLKSDIIISTATESLSDGRIDLPANGSMVEENVVDDKKSVEKAYTVRMPGNFMEQSVRKNHSTAILAPKIQKDNKRENIDPKKSQESEKLLLSKTNSQSVISTSKDVKLAKSVRSNNAPNKLAVIPVSTKDEEKFSLFAPIRSKSTTNLRNLTNIKTDTDAKKGDQQKLNFSLTGPAVNMNKASQVRQAYNQNKAPQKSPRAVAGKNFVGLRDNKFVANRQSKGVMDSTVQSSHPAFKWTMRRSNEPSSGEHPQKKNWINYTRKCDSAPTARGLVRSITSLAESQITKRAPFTISNGVSCINNNDRSRSACSLASTASSGQSWADKVKGCSGNSEIEQSSAADDDNEGWEVVRRGRRSQSSLTLNSPSKSRADGNSKSKAFSLKMQKRFSQPTAAVSLPSLINETSSNDPPSPISSPENSKESGPPMTEGRSRNNVECRHQESSGQLKKSEKNISNHLRREECKANEAKVINGNHYNKVAKTIPTKSESQRARKECISVNENTSDSEREEEEMTKNEVAFASAIKEEQRLKKQIEETEKNSIEVDVEEEVEVSSDGTSTVQEDEHPQRADSDWSLELPERSYTPIPTLSWADMGPIDPLQDTIRQPGRVLHIHEKLSSPARRLTSSEKLKRHQQKLAKAEELRGKLIQEKTEKLKDLFRRIEEVTVDKDRLLLEKRHLFEKKMARAEEKRKLHLQQIVDKAHDEETKAREIAFINDLEAQNKLHDIMQLHQSHESRLAEIAEERSRKLEEKAAKETAAQERRKAIEAERQARMAALCEKRRRRCERIDRQQAERREELLEQAREKAREREERLSALQQAQQTKEIELVKKIQQKQEETARRHDENIELIRQRALESSITRCFRGCDDAPKLLRYETKKLCTLCNCLIASEVYLLSHLKGKRHQEVLREFYKDDVSNEQTVKYNLKHIVDAPENMDDPEISREQERQKSLKKRCRKIRSRMVSRGNQFLKDFKPPSDGNSKFKARIAKALHQISKLVSSQGSGIWPSSDVSALDKNVLDLHRVIDGGDKNEATVFLSLQGFKKLYEVLDLINTAEEGLSCVLPSKSLSYAIRVINAACVKMFINCEYILQSNFIVNAVDQLNKRLTELADDVLKHVANGSACDLASDPVCTGLMELIGYILETVLKNELGKTDAGESMTARIKEFVSYCVSVGIVDKLTWYFNRVQGPVNNDQPSTDFILASMKILSSLTCCLTKVHAANDPTQLISTIQVTDSYGVVSLLYGLLLHDAERSVSPPSDYFSPSTLAITDAGTTLLCNFAELDLKLFQNILGSEGISLELRHICSFLLWYCSHWPNENILHNIIVLVGFFAVNNKENQSIMQSGESPSVLQQLCILPWNYFTDTRLTSILFPTLLASCLNNPDNMRIIEQEMSFQILQEFFTKNEASEKPLVKILHKIQTIL